MGIESSHSGVYLHVDFPSTPNIRFNRAKVRRAFVDIGRTLLRDARRRVARRAISQAGQAPGFDTGALAKSIGYFVPRPSGRRPGFMVKVSHNKGEGARTLPENNFYPAYLYYGVKQQARRRKKHHKGASGGSGWRIAPRENYLVKVMTDRKYMIQRTLFEALKSSVRPDKKK
ncbi:MAG: hypothetical protein ACRC9O_09795 [Plesiomonas sp.]|uniref:hypothetical protein n=1 Tax=Plesiomonas sp. TaxID=2486279 RepID=UPI003F37C8EB